MCIFIMGRLLWMGNNRVKCLFIISFFHLFVCFFVRSCDRSCISSACVQEKKTKKKKKKTHVTCKSSGKTKRPFIFYLFIYLFIYICFNYYYFFLYCKDPAQTVQMHIDYAHVHADPELCWSYVFLDTVPYFICLFFCCKDSKTLIRL